MERRYTDIESRWQALEGAFGDVAALRELASRFAWPVDSVPQRVESARRGMGHAPISPAEVDRAAEEARHELQELSHAAAGPLSAELARYRGAAGARPSDPVVAHRIAVLVERADTHLASGRTLEAARVLLELRESTPRPETETPPASSQSGPAPPGAPPGIVGVASPPTADRASSLESLYAKARDFAVRLPTLPPGSTARRQAAAGIREATELLKQGRLSEADAVLTRLMGLFDAPESTR